jgi:hemolysin III
VTTRRQVQGEKPKLRGLSHLIGAFLAAAAGTVLVTGAPTQRAAWAAGVYAVSLVTLFGVSALYHVPMWRPSRRRWLRHLDHAAIFVLIAGSYTPICLLGLGDRGSRLLVLVWVGAGLGILKSLLWPQAPKPVSAFLYVGLGWIAVSEWTAVRAALDGWSEALLIVGGALYTLGAVIYAARRPDPHPEVFGYHELFHVLVVLAAGFHYVAIARLILAAD